MDRTPSPGAGLMPYVMAEEPPPPQYHTPIDHAINGLVGSQIKKRPRLQYKTKGLVKREHQYLCRCAGFHPDKPNWCKNKLHGRGCLCSNPIEEGERRCSMCERGSNVKGPKSPGPKTPTNFVSTFPPSVDPLQASIVTPPTRTIAMDIPITHPYPATTSMGGMAPQVCVQQAGQTFAIASSPPPPPLPPPHHQQCFTQLLNHEQQYAAMVARVNSGPILEGRPEAPPMHKVQRTGTGSRKKQVLKEEVLHGHQSGSSVNGMDGHGDTGRALASTLCELGQMLENLRDQMNRCDAKYKEACEEFRKHFNVVD
mmetsp:Transcript_2084/g.5780  ORF Transcript_2084/g.5780 Transcript_2084/m.5780 type:complete len:312 (+) Transcript_2084:78-1013(+)